LEIINSSRLQYLQELAAEPSPKLLTLRCILCLKLALLVATITEVDLKSFFGQSCSGWGFSSVKPLPDPQSNLGASTAH
jgi:hypothetical protein